MRILRYVGIAVIAAVLVVAGYCYSVLRHIPDLDIFRTPSRHAELLEYSYHLPTTPPFRIEPVSYADIPPGLVNSFVASSDSRFFTEKRYYPRDCVDSFSMLLAKRFLPKTHREAGSLYGLDMAIITFMLENRLSKEEIFCAYINTVYFGGYVYGADTASRIYFAKPARELSLKECAMLAMLRPNGKTTTPFMRYNNMEEVVLWVFERMLHFGLISKGEFEGALREEGAVEKL